MISLNINEENLFDIFLKTIVLLLYTVTEKSFKIYNEMKLTLQVATDNIKTRHDALHGVAFDGNVGSSFIFATP